MSRRPPERSSKSDCVIAALRDDILTLALAPGAKLATGALRIRYGGGQAPLREALSALSGAGLVTRESRRGFRVAPMSLERLDDLVATRVTVELAMLERAVATADAGWKVGLRAALDALVPSLQKVGDGRRLDREWEDRHRRFHFAMLATDAAPLLAGFCEALYDSYDRYRLLGVPRRAYLAGIADDHADMAQAAIAGDAAAAAAILRRHIEDASATVRANIVEGGLLDRTGWVRTPPVAPDLRKAGGSR